MAKSKYEEKVKSRFKEIKDWCQNGATDKEIMNLLHISKDTYYRYMNKYKDFSDLIKENRKYPVEEIKNALYRRAVGFKYIEKKESVTTDKSGTPVIKEETITKHALPDPASCLILLKHWDKKNGWTNDPMLYELKKRKLDLEEKNAQEKNW